ncbi:MAG: hypothetical protein MHM6MM_009186 [Cercozoa sp. M6MM]
MNKKNRRKRRQQTSGKSAPRLRLQRASFVASLVKMFEELLSSVHECLSDAQLVVVWRTVRCNAYLCEQAEAKLRLSDAALLTRLARLRLCFWDSVASQRVAWSQLLRLSARTMATLLRAFRAEPDTQWTASERPVSRRQRAARVATAILRLGGVRDNYARFGRVTRPQLQLGHSESVQRWSALLAALDAPIGADKESTVDKQSRGNTLASLQQLQALLLDEPRRCAELAQGRCKFHVDPAATAMTLMRRAGTTLDCARLSDALVASSLRNSTLC